MRRPASLGNEVDPRVRSPPARPLIPEPHPLQLTPVERIGSEIPATEQLELLPADAWIRSKPRQQSR
jgi:hypothetical protein